MNRELHTFTSQNDFCVLGRAPSSVRSEADHRGAVTTEERRGGRDEDEKRGGTEGDGREEKGSSEGHQTLQ